MAPLHMIAHGIEGIAFEQLQVHGGGHAFSYAPTPAGGTAIGLIASAGNSIVGFAANSTGIEGRAVPHAPLAGHPILRDVL